MSRSRVVSFSLSLAGLSAGSVPISGFIIQQLSASNHTCRAPLWAIRLQFSRKKCGVNE
ncbi:hypothetical protein DL93DRAFT_2075844 [Clavulina sp. PMI_390]|nr:hypothetical protein DL93DRAFT_2075844 [Clavulina sp. PMI_390]